LKLSDQIKAQVSLKDVAERAAGVKWDMRKSNPGKRDWWAPCPFHGEKTSSFHVVEKAGTGGTFKCFGCGVGGSVIDFASEWHGIGFVDAVRMLARENGITTELSPERKAELEAQREKAKDEAEAEAARLADLGHRYALEMWAASARNTPTVMAYLAARGVQVATLGGVPATLREASHLPHRENGGPVIHTGPAMVAAIGRDRIMGVHRTWITPQARARHADGRKIAKQWLGRTGEMMGRPVVLSPPSPRVMVGEGIETALSTLSWFWAAGSLKWSAEAALSRGAITGPAREDTQLWTPRPGTREVLILGEGSSKNPQEAQRLYEGARARLEALGLKVYLRVPHGRWDLDLDFADVALSELGAHHG
jgi:hypothetical protein